MTVSQTPLVFDDLDSLRNNDQVLGRVSLSWELPDNFLSKNELRFIFSTFIDILKRVSLTETDAQT